MKKIITSAALLLAVLASSAQTYQGIVDKTIAIIGDEMITLSTIESEVQMMRAQGMGSDQNMRCEILEDILVSKLFLMQARVDSLELNQDMVAVQLNQRFDQLRTQLGGDEGVEEYFGKSIFKLRNEWKTTIEEQTLTQQMQSEIAKKAIEVTPESVQSFIANAKDEDLPIIPIKYQLSHICVYPDVEAAKMAVKERLLSLRERVIAGEKFSTLARLYSEDPGSYRKGGELGMASKSIFWPAFSDAAMSLRPGVVSQVVETPDGFHIIEVIEKKGDMFNARHILIKPKYTAEDQEKAFHVLDSLKTELSVEAITFPMAALYYSQDPATRTNGGRMVDPNTGSSYFEVDQLKPEDYRAIKGLKEGEISAPVESLDNEGRNGNTVYKILKVDKIIPAHTANFENDYDEIVSIVKQKYAQEQIDGFIDSKIGSTYIVIDPLFGNCEFKREGWKEKVRK